MDRLNFDELICKAKEIDREIIYLKSKIMEPSKLGLERSKAMEVLKGLDKELFLIKNKCTDDLKATDEESESAINDITNLDDYLKNLSAELDKIESEAEKYGYETYENHLLNKRKLSISPDLSGITALSMTDSQLLTPVGPSRRLYGRNQRYVSSPIDHNLLSSTPN